MRDNDLLIDFKQMSFFLEPQVDVFALAYVHEKVGIEVVFVS